MKPVWQRALAATERLLGADTAALAQVTHLRAYFAGAGFAVAALPLVRPTFGVRIVTPDVVTFHLARPEAVDFCLQSLRVSKMGSAPTRWVWYHRGQFRDVTDVEFLGRFLQGMGTAAELHAQAVQLLRQRDASNAAGDKTQTCQVERAVSLWWNAITIQRNGEQLQRSYDWSWRVTRDDLGYLHLEIVRQAESIANLTYEHFTEQQAQVIVAFLAHQDWPGIGHLIGDASRTYHQVAESEPDTPAYYAARHHLFHLEQFYDAVRATLVHG